MDLVRIFQDYFQEEFPWLYCYDTRLFVFGVVTFFFLQRPGSLTSAPLFLIYLYFSFLAIFFFFLQLICFFCLVSAFCFRLFLSYHQTASRFLLLFFFTFTSFSCLSLYTISLLFLRIPYYTFFVLSFFLFPLSVSCQSVSFSFCLYLFSRKFQF